MTDENVIIIKEEGFADNLGFSHSKGACVLANGVHPGKDGQLTVLS